jgi:ATP-dependent Clp protease ATP-binding subunit ClpX
MEHVKLKFTDGSLAAIAKEALKRNTGARGLRSILENTMLDIMYEIPSQSMVKEVVISEDVILRREKPIIVYEGMAETA